MLRGIYGGENVTKLNSGRCDNMQKLVKNCILFLVGSIVIVGSIFVASTNSYSCEALSTKVKASTDIYQSPKRYPQTIIYDVVSTFLSQENEKKKKVLVLGFDGFREDALESVIGMDRSAITQIMKQGGLYHSLAGADGNQETSTAPGWLSILHGNWAYQLGVHDNDGVKPLESTTFLTEAADNGYHTTFIASWEPHFDTTYREDIANLQNHVVYQKTGSDEETTAKLNEIVRDTSETSFDIIFSTFEYADHAGHTLGYGNAVEGYRNATKMVDNIAYEIIEMIANREQYHKEDWLIIITTDHGGIGTSHGGQREEEKNTWFVVNKHLDQLL